MFTMARAFVERVVLDFGLLHSIATVCFVGCIKLENKLVMLCDE